MVSACLPSWLIIEESKIETDIGLFLSFPLDRSVWNIGRTVRNACLTNKELPTQDVYQQALKYSHELGYIILALAVVIVAFLVYKGLKKK